MVKKAAEATPNRLLREARKERNWTQKEVADRIGAPQSFNVSRWEQGTAFPSAHYIQQLCLLFGKSAKDLGLLQEEATRSSEPSTEANSHSFWNVPYRRNPFFTGREEILKQLHDKLTTTQSAALTQIQAISGLGGIGKTQIAVEYAYRYRDTYQAVLWARASSRDALISDFVSLADLFFLTEANNRDQTIVVTAVKRWLTEHAGWLLILDNSDDFELIADFLPPGDNGHILLTTRAQATGNLAPSIVIEKMEKNEGARLLLCRAKLLALAAPLEQVGEKEWTQAEEIVVAMDGLPLALDQAGAYIEETGCDLAGYLELYRSHRKELLQRRSALRADHPEPVASTWALSFLKVERASPAAADLLRLCAFLDPDAIPEEIVTNGSAMLGPKLGSITDTNMQLNEAIQELRRFSLVKRDPEAKLIYTHRLVQTVLKDEMDQQTQQQWAERVVRAVNTTFPEVTFPNWKQCDRCLPHVWACAELIDQYRMSFPEAARLLHHAGIYLRDRGLYEQAEVLLQRALAILERVFGLAHPQAATILNDLGWFYYLQGKYEQAEPLLQQALAIYEQVLGPEHSDIAITLNNLAWLYMQQGRYAEAELLYQRSLNIREKVLGDLHPETARSLNDLGWLYYLQGKYEQAEPLLQRALAIRERALGPTHPDVGESLNNLAILYYFQGKYEQAESLFQRALSIREQALGSIHPDVGESLNNLARVTVHQGKYEQAESLFQRALSIREQALGPDHSFTAITLDNLGLLYQAQGKYEQAEPLHQRALAIFEKVLGPEHPDTAIALQYLAQLYHSQNQYEQAQSLYLRALAIFERVLGPEHTRVAQSLHNLAQLSVLQGKYEQAELLFQRALSIYEQALGSEHPDTSRVREDYTDLLQTLQ
jgi:tetratricopeptide (TPR) repeat protein/transcriptional regulator with XRE-family HTH domain